jgi:site-specific DNA-methyltransferase (adenine-specific)
MPDESIDMIFADPPFNLDKFYLSKINDDLKEVDYLAWCEEWIFQCTRVLKKGGSFFLWNLPKWNTYLSEFLNHYLSFRHWIATDIKFSLPIQGKLYPSHYSLLYYTKGRKPKTFKPDRMGMEVCPKCFGDLKDYGGYKNKMNPKGVNLTDVWLDIPPVRHKKYKRRKEANELSIKLLDRIVEMSTKPGDIIFDPFGGAGTTYVVSEIKNRNWIGIELGPVEQIIERLTNYKEEVNYLKKYRENYNALFPEKVKKSRVKRGLWTNDTFAENKKEKAGNSSQGELFGKSQT